MAFHPSIRQIVRRVFNSVSKAIRVTGIDSDRSAFGDNLVATAEPITQLSGQYGTPSTAETFNATGGTVTNENNMFVLKTGTSIGGYGVLRTKRPTVYREGQGLTGRFTAIFDSENAVENSLQFAGFFNVQDTIAFGYRGTNFGIIHDSYGVQETRTLTITSSGNGTLTLTLNSINYSIPITSGTVNHNAYEISAWMNDSANQSVWNVQQIEDTVVFQNKNAAAAAGTYSISGTTLAGTFSTQATGAAKEAVTVNQSSWNGEDVSSWFDPSKSNIYMIKLAYLGFGAFKFYIANEETGEFVLVHTIINNSRAKPSISNRALKIGWTAASLGSTTDITVKGASCATFVDGESRLLVPSLAHSNSNNAVSTSFVAILTIAIKQNFKGKAALGRCVPIALEISSDSTKETRFQIVKNATLGETDFQDHGENDLVVYDTIAHTLSSDREFYAGSIGAGGSKKVDLSKLNIDVLLGDTVTVFARVVSGSASNVTASLVWKEDL